MAVAPVAHPVERRIALSRGSRLLRPRPDIAVAALYLVVAFGFSGRLWLNPSQRVPLDPEGAGDHTLFQFMLAHAARVVSGESAPFFTTQANAAVGVNMMANTSVLGLGVPAAPITLLFGPHISYALLLTLSLAGTAFGWYYVLSRRYMSTRPGAAFAGLLIGFGPGMISHAQGHLNWVALFLVPFIVDRVFQMRHGTHWRRDGLILGLLVTYQAFINEEVLLFIALGTSVFALSYLALRWTDVKDQIPGFLKGLAVAVATAAPLLAYPLWFQFFGPQSYRAVRGSAVYGTDLAAFTSFSRWSLAGDTASSSRLAVNGTEENSFFGWPLVLLFVVLCMVLWRMAAARAALITAIVFALLSLGPHISIGGHETGIPGPWQPLGRLPLLDSVVPTRLSLIMLPCIAVVLGLGIDRLVANVPTVELRRRWLGIIAVGAAVVPVVPMPLSAREAPKPPQFVIDRGWEPYTADGRSMVLVSGDRYNLRGMRWAASSRLDFAIAGGYFLMPSGDGGDAINGAPLRPTTVLFQSVVSSGVPADIMAGDRQDFCLDLQFWNAGVLVLPQSEPQHDALSETVSNLVGRERTDVGGVSLWDVRDRSSSACQA